MNFEYALNDNSLNVKLTGRVDVISAPVLHEKVNFLLSSNENLNKLIFDFSEVSYISSMGLRILLDFQKTMAQRGSMKVINVSSDVFEIFKATGFDNILSFS